MYYRLKYNGKTTTIAKEFSGSQSKAITEARRILSENDKKGSVDIERKPSEYDDVFSDFLTISYNQEIANGLVEL